MLSIAIGSCNPVKIQAVQSAFQQCFPHYSIDCVGVPASSSVSDQPSSNEETKLGAHNRCIHAISLYKNQMKKLPDYSVGLEGGVEENLKKLENKNLNMENENLKLEIGLSCFAQLCIFHVPTQKWGTSKTASFALPDAIVSLMKTGMELGDADDLLFKRKNSKQSDGSVGYLTHGNITRTDYYHHALMLALIPFLHPELYDQ